MTRLNLRQNALMFSTSVGKQENSKVNGLNPGVSVVRVV